MAALIAISRLFLLRVPSEGVPLEWNGDHSSIQVEGGTAWLTLMRRKNLNRPSVLERHCCCQASGRHLCAIHWLHYLRENSTHDGKLFNLTAQGFLSSVRRLAEARGFENASKIGTHSFRRGMSEDIFSSGTSRSAPVSWRLAFPCISQVPQRLATRGSSSCANGG